MSGGIGRNGRGLDSLRRGDAVGVRGLDEILATLDADAKLDGLPFMPEMVPFCGGTYRVHRRAEKTCVEGLGIRAMQDTVLLEGLRCDGSAHDGCQRGCLLFWKKAWLRPADKTPDVGRSSPDADPSRLPTKKDDRFFCQSTELAGATLDYRPGRVRHHLHDLRVGEITLGRFLFLAWMALTNRLWRLAQGHSYYKITGGQKKTASESLHLEAGEWVEVKSAAEIEATLDAEGRNRGLSFEPEMARYCGRRYRVATPIRSVISEQTGKMIPLSATVILEGVDCQGICFHNCPRANHFYWREIWLRRV